MNERFDPEDFPSLDLAYEWVEPSYDWAIRRFDAAEVRIQTFLSFVATVTVAVPLIVQSQGMAQNLLSGWFLGAIAAFLACASVAIGSRFWPKTGEIEIIDLKSLYRDWLNNNQATFKMDMIIWAGEHLRRNNEAVRYQTRIVGVMSLLFAVEIVCLSVWVVGLN